MFRTNEQRLRAARRGPLAAALLLLVAWSAPGRAQQPALGVWQRKTVIERPDGTFNPDGAKALIGNGVGEVVAPVGA
jgi:hypothetical protein